MSFLGARSRSLLPFGFLILFALFSASINAVQAQTRRKQENPISAIFVFGDSTVDPGNNNYIATASRSNFPPYGKDFVNHSPTGRFSNGRLPTDFIASYMGIKEFVPPYLDPTLTIQELMTGVSFASGSSGFDALTAQLAGVIPMQKQLEHFIEYKKKMEKTIGEEKTTKLINKAAFLISAGTNDFVVTYYGSQVPRSKYTTVSSYQQFILQTIQKFTQGLIDQGARLIAVAGVPPMGCLPAVITLFHNDGFYHRKCVEGLSYVGRDYNEKLQKKLKALQISSKAKFYYVDIFTPLDYMIKNPTKFGFSSINVGCCGSGLLEASLLCNYNSNVCADRSKYIFWDAIHPTEAAYDIIFKSLKPLIDGIIKE